MQELVEQTVVDYTELIKDIKGALRISSNDELIEKEITDLVETALLDLKTSGITNLDITDPFIKRAVSVYCKANFGYDNPESEKFTQSYETIKCKLSLVGGYSG